MDASNFHFSVGIERTTTCCPAELRVVSCRQCNMLWSRAQPPGMAFGYGLWRAFRDPSGRPARLANAAFLSGAL